MGYGLFRNPFFVVFHKGPFLEPKRRRLERT